MESILSNDVKRQFKSKYFLIFPYFFKRRHDSAFCTCVSRRENWAFQVVHNAVGNQINLKGIHKTYRLLNI